MPAVDVETLVCGVAGEAKVVCETLIGPEEKNPAPPDLPPESFLLRKEDEIEWFGRNAFFERKQSARRNLNLRITAPAVASPRAIKGGGAFLGLPKLQDSGRIGRCRVERIRFFPKAAPESESPEPTSPKVSCVGRVRSRKERRRRRRGSKRGPRPQQEEAESERRSWKDIRESSIWRKLQAVIWIGRRRPPQGSGTDDKADSPPVSLSTVTDSSPREPAGPPGADPPGLGSMRRFSSGRRPASWDGDEADRDLDPSRPSRGQVWKRRPAAGPPPQAAECIREPQLAGPVTV